MRLAEADGRRRRDLSPAALDAARSLSTARRTCRASKPPGVIVRVPSAWRGNVRRVRTSARPSARKPPSGLGAEALLDFQMDVTLDGETLTDAEIEQLLAAPSGLALVRGRWVEVDRDKLARMLDHFERVEQAAAEDGLSFAEAMRLRRRRGRLGRRRRGRRRRRLVAHRRRPLAGRNARRPSAARGARARRSRRGAARDAAALSADRACAGCICCRRSVSAPAWPTTWASARPCRCWRCCWSRNSATSTRPGGRACSSRPRRCSRTGRRRSSASRRACGRSSRIRPRCRAAELRALDRERVAGVDLGHHQLRIAAARSRADEDRVAPRDPRRGAGHQESGARSRRAPRSSSTAQARIALTGTPVENRLGDLWSIFDFINPGLLGSRKEFTAFTKRLAEAAAAIRTAAARSGAAVHPAAAEDRQDRHLRSAGQDRSQGVLPAQPHAGGALSAGREGTRASRSRTKEGIERRGIVLASLMRFKQICNHPSQWLGDGAVGARRTAANSRGCARLRKSLRRGRRRCSSSRSSARSRAPLADFLGTVFGAPRPRAARRDGGAKRAGARRARSRRTRRCRSSCSRSRRAASASI